MVKGLPFVIAKIIKDTAGDMKPIKKLLLMIMFHDFAIQLICTACSTPVKVLSGALNYRTNLRAYAGDG